MSTATPDLSGADEAIVEYVKSLEEQLRAGRKQILELDRALDRAEYAYDALARLVGERYMLWRVEDDRPDLRYNIRIAAEMHVDPLALGASKAERRRMMEACGETIWRLLMRAFCEQEGVPAGGRVPVPAPLDLRTSEEHEGARQRLLTREEWWPR